MTHIRSHLFLAATVAGLAFSSGASAQGPGGPGGPRPRGAQGGAPGMARGADAQARGGARGNPAAMLLRLRSQLSLTDEQVKKLESLQNSASPKPNASDRLRAQADLMDAMQGDGNLAKARTALDRMSALRNEQMITALRQRQEVRAVLTTAQKSTLDNLRQQRAGKARRGRGQGGRGMNRGQGPRGQGAPGMGAGGMRGRGMGGPGMGQPPMAPNGNRRRGMMPPAGQDLPPDSV
ncbi:Spy/CpxP family protein refolding chaperone [Gemmatimonas sp.]|uniref:Spy/CpxP family protein refolding chaperone n=1 Tax=Gemmatimonas sp. TaxID=1962908 RepID=UPI0033423D4B